MKSKIITGFIRKNVMNHYRVFGTLILSLFLIFLITIYTQSATAAPEGYCEEASSDIHLATWITDVDYTLYPSNKNPESIKLTVDFFFSTDGFCGGWGCQPDPDCNKDFRYVNAWIDWDGDYNFDSSEQVLDEELFWYDEAYQDWLITTHEGDPSEIWDIIMLPRENFTGKSIKWFAFDSYAGGMGIMTVSKIIPIPDDYVNDTWMRVNYGWLYNPQNPCDVLAPTGADPYLNWEWGDASYKQISTTPDLCINSSDISIKQKTNTAFPYHDFKDSVLTVTVHNKGKTKVEHIDVLMIKTDENENILSSETKTINSILAQNHVNITFEGNFDPYRFNDILIDVDPENKIWETDEDNNDAKTYSVQGYISQHNITTTNLPKTRVDLQQKNGTTYQVASITVTNEDGLYRFWTNLECVKQGVQSYVSASLEYVPEMKFPGLLYVINETYFGDNILPNNPNALTANFKFASPWTLQKDQDSTHNITFSGVEGGLAYQTLITLYNYHKNLKTAPNFVVVNINDNDGDTINDNAAYAYQNGYTIHLPPGKLGTTDPFTIGHEFTHIVERGWIPTYYGHNPLVPVEEGSCHWGSCIALENPVLDFEDGTGGFVIIDISNNSHTSNSPPVPDSFVGCREEFQIAGTIWDLNTSLVWKILRYGFGSYLSPWPSTPLLFYSAYKELDSRSSLALKAIFQSHAYSTIGWPGKDGLDPDYFTDTFSDQGIDADGDGKFEILQVTAELNIATPGTYILTGSMNGVNIGASNTTYLDPGIQLVNLSFFGENIYENQQEGPYNLSFYLYYDNYTFLDNRLSFYETQLFTYTDFERPTLIFTGNHTIETVDEDSDGTSDQLIIDLELNLTRSSYVKMYASLYCNDVFIDNCWGPSMNDDAIYEYIEAGVHNLSLFFNGESIHASRQNGTYELKTYLSSARTISLGVFHYTDFDTPPAVLGDIIGEYVIDNDDDGFSDSLNVNISITGLGTYALTGHLYNGTGAHILTTFEFGDINDTQSLLLIFDGTSIRDQKQSGVYNLTIEIYDKDGFFIGWKNYMLLTYAYADFEPASEDVFDITFNEHGVDTNGNYGYETLCVDMDISTLIPGSYGIEGYLYTDGRELICSDETTDYIDTSVTTYSLCFNGQQLGSTLYNGSYTLDLVFINDSEIIELSQAYTTAPYTFELFESTYMTNTTEMLYSTNGNENIPNKLGFIIETYSTVPRYVTFKAQLRDSAGDLIDEAETGDIWAYENDSALVLFNGYKILDHGIDGPYTLILNLYDAQGTFLDTYSLITGDYDHTSFALITLTGLYSDYGYDVDSNAIFDYLVIESDVQVFANGFCTISGVLEDSTGQIITTTENTLWLSEGLQTLPLYFNGTIIKNHEINGPYTLKLVSVFHNQDVSTTDYMLDAYQTSFYDYTNFDLTTSTIPNQKPVSIASGPIAGSKDIELQFNASASYDPEGHSLTYHWDFGDGSTSTDELPTHSYSTNGTFTVNLTVNDGTHDSYPDSFIVSIGCPVANTGGPYTVYGIQPLTFNGSRSIDPEDDGLIYHWNFGDGTTGSVMNPAHTYTSYGVYTVTLTVTDGTYESTATTTVTVLKSLFFDDEPSDNGFDTNNDGLYEYLLMEVDVTNYVPQNISAEVTLIDSLGTVLSYGVSDQFLNMSSYRLSIYFDGTTFFENRVPGPYFVEIIIRDNENEVLDSLNYTTTGYEFTDFQYNTKIGAINDEGIDTNGNGSYDYLSINVSLINSIYRNITLQGNLLNNNGTSITTTQETASIAGNTTIQLLFDGKTIYKHGENGPYAINLILKNEYGQIIDAKESSTSSYQYTDFEEFILTVWTVDDDDGDVPSPPADFSMIQQAIDAASDGDIIQVYPGTYYESVDLNKTLTLLGIDQPLIDVSWAGHGIDITANQCHIEGFEITNAFMGDPDIFTAGLYIQSHYNTIMNNTLYNNENGITLVESHDNVLDSNHLTNINSGLILLSADRNLIKNNNFLENSYGIIIFENSSENLIYLNTIGKQNDNAIDYTTNNSWNSTVTLSYTYNGVDHSGYVGNYWDDHISVDTDNNGVYDVPYTIIEGSGYAIDYYPMVGNWPPNAEANGAYRADSDQDIQFNSSGSYDPEGQTLTYLWDFGDGNTSTEANPIHAYNSSERVKLYPELNVSDGVHNDTDTATVYVNYPIALSGGPYYATEGISIQLDGSTSYDPLAGPYQSYPLQYYWYPADGSSGGWSISSKKYVRYDSEGEYRPYLWVKTNTGYPYYYSEYSYTTVYVNDTEPSPDFTANQQNGVVPLTIEFTDQSESYDGVTQWDWDFDNDGTIDRSGTDALAQNPSFTYTTAGVYSVNLTVHEADGDKVSMIKTDYITVIETRPPITIYVPDDYPTIQESIDAGTTLDGDTIIVRDGIYRQNTIVNKELTIRSENGSDNCQLFPDIPLDNHMITISSNNVTIDGFYMNGTRTSGDWCGSVYSDGFENVTISNNWINDTCNGILLHSLHDSYIVNNTAINCFIACVNGKNVQNISIINNNLSDGGTGLSLGDGDYCHISNNTVNNSGYGMVIDGDHNIINGNSMNGNLDGLRIDRGDYGNYYDYNIICNNIMNFNADCGLEILSKYNTIYNNTLQENNRYDLLITVSDNNVYSNTGSEDRPIIFANGSRVIENMEVSEIILLNADYSLISNVTVAGSDILKNNGIYARSCDHVQFINVTSNHNYHGIDMTPTFGYSLLVGQDDNIFTDCAFNDNRFIGVKIGGDGNKIENCDTSYNGQYGVYFYECSEDSAIVNSTIKNNNWSGIYLRVDYTIFTIKNNTINGNSRGIYCTSGDYIGYTYGNVTIDYNMISNNTDGIRIAEGDHLHTYSIQHNIILDNDNCGLYAIVEYANLQITMNTIAENDWGISCENTYWDENAHANITYNTILENNNGIGITKINDHPNNYLISENVIENNADYGIYISPVSGSLQIVNNSLIGNTNGISCNHDTNSGIPSQVTFNHNIITSNDNAINISDNCVDHVYLVNDNVINNNAVFGITLNDFSGDLQVVDNMIAFNHAGIYCADTTCDPDAQVNITYNIISNNEEMGIKTNNLSIHFLIYNNIIVNNLVFDTNNNLWNISKTSGQNIIGGPFLGGNYWSSYTGEDTNGDAIGDTNIPFNASGSITTGGDYYPLVLPQEPYLLPISNQMMYKDTKCLIPICALGTESNALILTTDTLPTFCIFTDLGDGIGTVDIQPDENNSGEYTITVYVTDGVNTISESFNLIVLAEDHLPEASFIFEPVNPSTEDIVHFNSTSTDADGFIVNYTWNIEDGTLYGEQVIHQFFAAGTYDVCLTVEDNNGFTSTSCQSIVIDVPLADVGVNTILSPNEGSEVGILPVQIEVENYGNTNEYDIPLHVKIGMITGNPVFLLRENFSDLATGDIPTGWNRTHTNWGAYSSDQASGEIPEMRFHWDPDSDDIFRLISPPIDTSSYSGLTLSFKHNLDHYGEPYTLRVQSSTDKIIWTDLWTIDPTGDIGPEILTINLSSLHGVGSDTLYLAWTFDGDSYNVDDWYIDDIMLLSLPTSTTVYDETLTVDLTSGQQLLVDSFPDWTAMVEGTYTIECLADLPGDVNLSNNGYTATLQLNGTAPNQPPVADAGGPYFGDTFALISLDGSGSYDLDGTIVAYEWDLDDDGLYDDATGVSPSYSWDSSGTYHIALQVTDDDSATNTDETTVVITTPNSPPNTPTNPNPADTAVDVPLNPTLSWTGGDPNPGDTVTYDIYIGTNPTPPQVESDYTAATYTPGILDYDTTYYWKIIAKDNYDATTEGAIWSFTTGQEPNNPPVADARGPYSGDTGTPITLDGTASYDTDGTIVSFEWDLDDDGYFDDATGANPTFTWTADGIHTIHLQVTDDDSATNTDTTTVTTTTPNSAPTADCGGPYQAMMGQSLDLDGSGSTDSDGSIVSYEWDLDDDGYFDDAVGMNPSFTWSTPGVCTIHLFITDNDGATDTNTTTVTIINQAPYTPTNPAPSNQSQNIVVQPTLSWIGGDPDSMDSVAYTIYFGTSQNPVQVFSNNATLSYNPGLLSYDTTYYWYIVSEDNHGATTPGPLWSFTTQSMPNQPPVADCGGPYSAFVDEQVLLNASSSIDADGTIVACEWDLDDDGLYDDAAGFIVAHSWTTAGIYTIGLKVTDDGGATDTNNTTVTIFMPNQPPVAVNDSYTLLEDNTLILTEPGVLFNDYDVDSDSITAQLVSSVTHGTLLLYLNGSFTYIPDANYFGTDSFSYVAVNASMQSLPAVVNLSIQPVNDAPRLIDLNDYRMNESETLTIDCSASDIDTAVLNLQVSGLAAFGSFTDYSNGSGQFIFTAGFDDEGVYSITLHVSDGELNDSTQFSLTVENTNRPPSQPYNPNPTDGSTVEAGALCLSWTAEDSDSDSLSYDLFFGTTQNPNLIQTGLTQETYCSVDVEPAQHYYWQIQSIDTNGAATFGPIWSFTTSYTAELDVNKTVSSDGIHWSQNLTVESGEEVFWNISVCNCGQSLLTNVLLLDSNGNSYGPFNLTADEHRFFTYSSTVFEDFNNTVFASAVDCTGYLLEEESYAYVHVISDDTIDIEICKSATLEYVSSGDFEGLSHGFWKNHESEWVGYFPDDLTGEIFEIPHRLSCCNDSFHNALRFKGGSSVCKAAKLLMIQAVAALLNAAHPDINYPLSESEIITLVNDALATENRNTLLQLKDTLNDYNNCCGDKCCEGNESSEQIARITYTIHVINNGSIKATHIQITNTLLPQVMIASFTPTIGCYDQSSGIWSIDSLDVDDFAELLLVVEINNSGVLQNTVEVISADQVDSDSTPANGLESEDDYDIVVLDIIIDDE